MSILSQTRVAVISGGAGYIGGAIAKKLAADGFILAILYHEKPPDFSFFPGTGHRAYRCDLRRDSDIQTAVGTIAQEQGHLAVCVHAAESKIQRVPLADLSDEDIRKQFEVGVLGGFSLLSAAERRMPNGGVLIGITSIYAEPDAYAAKIGAYIPAKLALRGLLRILSKELASKNIRVHAVAPSFLPGGVNNDLPPEVARLLYEKSGNTSTAEDVGSTVSYLCSPAAEHVTGTSIALPSNRQTPL